MLHSIWILCAVFSTLNVAKASEYHHVPRIILTEKDALFRRSSRNGTHTRTELIPGTREDTIYVGGHRTLSYIDFQTPNQSKEVTMFENECRDKKTTGSCEYDITILHTIKGGTEIFVCGTNGISPVCCSTTQSKLGSCSSISAEGIAPISVKEKAPSIYIDDEMYTTANLYVHGDGVGIRRYFGTIGSITSRANKTEQRFVAITLSEPRDVPLQKRIYAFLVERNADKHPEASRWVSRVIQVCKSDRGGTKHMLDRLWTSLLSARLYCDVHFNKLLDVDVLHAANWRDSKVYTLFTNVWGMRAVCVYSMGAINDLFMNSKFKNSAASGPEGQRRMCVENSQKLPREVLKQMKDKQEMEDWIRPMKDRAPFMVSHRHYRHIRADRVIGRGKKEHTVLFLSLDSGKVHKVLEQAGPPFFIAELQPFRDKTHLQNMLLLSSKKKMYVSSSDEVVELDLRSCMKYGPRCEDCIQARDPYCGWDGTKCTAVSSEALQDVENGNYKVCEEEGTTDTSVVPHKAYSLPPLADHVLRCPMGSGHADHSWHHGGRRIECMQAEGLCLLLLKNMSPEQEGNYSCVSSEGGYERTLVRYELRIVSWEALSRPHIAKMLPETSTNASSSSTGVTEDPSSCVKCDPRCKDWVPARDPYCLWDGTKCTATSSTTVENGNCTECNDTGTATTSVPHSPPPSADHLLRCPEEWDHTDSWPQGGGRVECQLFMENMSPEHEVKYSCVSCRGSYGRTLVQYELQTAIEAKAASLRASVLSLLSLTLLY